MTNVKALPKDAGVTGWNAILSSQTKYPQLEKSQTCDNLIIGAGFAGLAIAHRIRQLSPNEKTIIIDATCIAEGPAGRNTGFMIDLPHDLSSKDYAAGLKQDQFQIKFNRAGIDFAAQAAKEFSMSKEAFVNCGKLNAAASSKGLQQNIEYAEHLTALHEAHEFLDEHQMHSLTGSHYYQGGLYTPNAAMIQPALFVRNFANRLAQHTSIYENSPIISLNKQGNAWLAKTAKASLSAKNVFLAVNGHLQSFGFYKRRLMHVFTYASMTRALSKQEIQDLGGKSEWALLPSHPMGTTIRRISGTGGDRIIIRNRFTYDPSMQVSNNRIKNVAKNHRQSFDARFPMLKHVDMQYQWGGRLCLSKNNVHVIRELDTGLFSACCQNGLGTAKGTAAGMLAADLAFNHQTDLLIETQAQAQPERLPLEPLSWLGANTYMRWGEFRAGSEF